MTIPEKYGSVFNSQDIVFIAVFLRFKKNGVFGDFWNENFENEEITSDK